MSPLTLVQEAVKKAVPEIMELKFGCKVKLTKSCHSRDKGEVGVFAGQPDLSVIVFDGRHNCLLEDEDLEILGREIRLSDILRTIRNIERPLPGAMTDTWWNKQERKVLDLWDLEHDSLDWHATHRPEVIDFLVGLLE